MPTISEQGKIKRTDTTVNLTNWSSTGVSKVLHNSNQIVRGKFTQAIPNVSYYEDSSGNKTDYPYFIDGQKSKTSAPIVSNCYKLVTGFSNTSSQFTVTYITLYTESQITTPATTLTIEKSFDNVSFTTVTITSVTETYDNILDAYKYVINFASNSANYFRIKKTDNSAFTYKATEIEILPPLSPTMKFWFFGSSNPGESDGQEGISRDVPDGTLDFCYDKTNDFYYILKYNESGGYTVTTLSLDDDFTTVSGSTQFNLARWTESAANSAFIRSISNDNLVFATSSGVGELTSNFVLNGDFNVSVDFNISSLSSSVSNFQLLALDDNENVIGGLGVGKNTSNGDNNYFALYTKDLQSYTDNASMTKLRPVFNTTYSGTEHWVITHTGSNVWTVSGTQRNPSELSALGTATSGRVYSNDYFSCYISTTQTPSINEAFEFDIYKKEAGRGTSSGTLTIVRSTDSFNTNMVSTDTTISTGDVNIELYGTTSGTSINMTADNFTVAVGDGSFPNAPSLSIHKMNSSGAITTDIVSVLDVVGDLTYNDFLDGCVGIATDDDYVYVKVQDRLMKFDATQSYAGSDGSTNTEVATVGEIVDTGISFFTTAAFNVNTDTGEELVSSEYAIIYGYYDTINSQYAVKTISTTDLTDTSSGRQLLVDDSELTSTNRNFFINQNDYNTMYFVETDTSLYQYNTDDRLVKFISANISDPTLSAGGENTADVIASVANAWGTPLSGKTVSFAVTAGDGSVSPATRLTDNDGVANQATPQDVTPGLPSYTTGSSVGITSITVTVNQ